MKHVSISHLRQHLPEFIALAARGQTVRITQRGKTVADLVPAVEQEDDPQAVRARLRASVLRYDAPLEPVLPAETWDMNR